jgi:hypothetical protein
VSDYFGALMRSSALTIGNEPPAKERGSAAAQRPDERPGTATAGDPFADGIEVHAETYGESADAVAEPAGALDGSRREPSDAPAPHRHHLEPLARREIDVSVQNESGDLEHLRRAAFDAALRWVTTDRSTVRADNETTLARQTPAPHATDARDAGQRADVHVVGHVATRVVEPVFSPTSREGVSLAQFEIGSREIAPHVNADVQIRPDAPAAQPIEDIVDVSIGSIHVHVDGAPARQTTPAQGQTRERRERAPASGLERRYLRGI